MKLFNTPILCLIFLFCIAETHGQGGVQVVRTLTHRDSSFTQGLIFRDGQLYESTGLRGQSLLLRLDPQTGKILDRVALEAKYFGEGLEELGGELFQLTWQEQEILVWDKNLKSASPKRTLPLQGEGWGLAKAGQNLILSNGTDSLKIINPKDGKLIKTIQVLDRGKPLRLINELEAARGLLYANVLGNPRIAVIDFQSTPARVVHWIDCSALLREAHSLHSRADVLNGIAWDPNTDLFYITGKRWPRMYVVRLP